VPTTQINKRARAHPRSATSATDTDRYVVTQNDGQQVARFDIPTDAANPLVETYEYYRPIHAYVFPLHSA